MSQVFRSRRPSPEPSPSSFWIWYYVAVLLAGILTWSSVRAYLSYKDYQRGDRAYKSGNCEAAIAEFERVSARWFPTDFQNLGRSAQSKKRQCKGFQTAIARQESGQATRSLIAYNKVLASSPDTALRSAIQKNAANLFTETQSAKLTNPTLCAQLESFRRNQLLAIGSNHLPPLYQSCGQLYETQEKYSQAVVIYEQFLNAYPKHELAPTTQEKLAHSIIAEAKQQGAATLLQPQQSGYTQSGYVVLEIQNDSPTKIQLVFSGSETIIEEIEPCFDCKKYIGKGPESCPARGPVGRYTLKPGQYNIVVKSADKFRVTPYRGDWTLNPGTAYNQCFYIIQNPVEKQQKTLMDSDSQTLPQNDDRIPQRSFKF